MVRRQLPRAWTRPSRPSSPFTRGRCTRHWRPQGSPCAARRFRTEARSPLGRPWGLGLAGLCSLGLRSQCRTVGTRILRTSRGLLGPAFWRRKEEDKSLLLGIFKEQPCLDAIPRRTKFGVGTVGNR